MGRPVLEITKNILYNTGNEIKDNDIFLSHYKQAAEQLEEIVNISMNQKASKGSSEDESNYASNIIVFDGERGQGKTSAMNAFTNEIKKFKDNQKNNGASQVFSREVTPSVFEGSFHFIQSIDPSKFEDYSSIIRVVVSRMYRHFSELIEDRRHEKANHSEINHILELFSEVYESISILMSPNKLSDFEMDYETNLQKITRISDSTRLKAKLYKLIDAYCSFVQETDYNANCFLVISIDDLDLNFEKAYSIAEEIRKYLMIPNVIVVMALKFDQLRDCVAIEMESNTKMKLSSGSQYLGDSFDMANRYMNKLIPESRRIILSGTLEFIRDIDLKISLSNSPKTISAIDELKSLQEEIAKLDEVEIVQKPRIIERFIQRILFKRTGLLLTLKEEEENPFIPKTLRELVSLILYLIQLEDVTVNYNKSENVDLGLMNDSSNSDNIGIDVDKHAKNREMLLMNYRHIENLLYGSWLELYCGSKDREALKALRHVDKDNLIKNYVDVARAIFTSAINEDNYEDEVNASFTKFKKGLSKGRFLGIGNLRDCLKCIRNYAENIEDKNKAFFLELTLSIHLHRQFQLDQEFLKNIFRFNIFGEVDINNKYEIAFERSFINIIIPRMKVTDIKKQLGRGEFDYNLQRVLTDDKAFLIVDEDEEEEEEVEADDVKNESKSNEKNKDSTIKFAQLNGEETDKLNALFSCGLFTEYNAKSYSLFEFERTGMISSNKVILQNVNANLERLFSIAFGNYPITDRIFSKSMLERSRSITEDETKQTEREVYDVVRKIQKLEDSMTDIVNYGVLRMLLLNLSFIDIFLEKAGDIKVYKRFRTSKDKDGSDIIFYQDVIGVFNDSMIACLKEQNIDLTFNNNSLFNFKEEDSINPINYLTTALISGEEILIKKELPSTSSPKKNANKPKTESK